VEFTQSAPVADMTTLLVCFQGVCGWVNFKQNVRKVYTVGLQISTLNGAVSYAFMT